MKHRHTRINMAVFAFLFSFSVSAAHADQPYRYYACDSSDAKSIAESLHQSPMKVSIYVQGSGGKPSYKKLTAEMLADPAIRQYICEELDRNDAVLEEFLQNVKQIVISENDGMEGFAGIEDFLSKSFASDREELMGKAKEIDAALAKREQGKALIQARDQKINEIFHPTKSRLAVSLESVHLHPPADPVPANRSGPRTAEERMERANRKQELLNDYKKKGMSEKDASEMAEKIIRKEFGEGDAPAAGTPVKIAKPSESKAPERQEKKEDKKEEKKDENNTSIPEEKAKPRSYEDLDKNDFAIQPSFRKNARQRAFYSNVDLSDPENFKLKPTKPIVTLDAKNYEADAEPFFQHIELHMGLLQSASDDKPSQLAANIVAVGKDGKDYLLAKSIGLHPDFLGQKHVIDTNQKLPPKGALHHIRTTVEWIETGGKYNLHVTVHDVTGRRQIEEEIKVIHEKAGKLKDEKTRNQTFNEEQKKIGDEQITNPDELSQYFERQHIEKLKQNAASVLSVSIPLEGEKGLDARLDRHFSEKGISMKDSKGKDASFNWLSLPVMAGDTTDKMAERLELEKLRAQVEEKLKGETNEEKKKAVQTNLSNLEKKIRAMNNELMKGSPYSGDQMAVVFFDAGKKPVMDADNGSMKGYAFFNPVSNKIIDVERKPIAEQRIPLSMKDPSLGVTLSGQGFRGGYRVSRFAKGEEKKPEEKPGEKAPPKKDEKAEAPKEEQCTTEGYAKATAINPLPALTAVSLKKMNITTGVQCDGAWYGLQRGEAGDGHSKSDHNHVICCNKDKDGKVRDTCAKGEGVEVLAAICIP